jgi:hypothetical protein
MQDPAVQSRNEKEFGMKGTKAKLWAAGCLAASLAATGCSDYAYDDLVDPCWPQRYACMARNSVGTPFATQATNGLVLEQTIWDYHFAADQNGNQALTQAGIDHLNHLARRRPTPVMEVFVQTAQHVEYNAAQADQFVTKRTDTDTRRVKAVTDYLAAARPDVPFKVAVHDPQRVGMHGTEVARAVGNMQYSSVGNLGVSSGFGEGVPTHGNSREQFGPAGAQGPSGQTGPAAGPGGEATARAAQVQSNESFDINRRSVETIDQTVRPVPAEPAQPVPQPPVPQP